MLFILEKKNKKELYEKNEVNLFNKNCDVCYDV